MADDLTPPPGNRTGVIRAEMELDTSQFNAAMQRAGQATARVAAVYAVAALSGRSGHSQRCPVWVGRAKNVGLSRCSCWIVRDAERVVDTVLTALGQPSEGAPDGR